MGAVLVPFTYGLSLPVVFLIDLILYRRVADMAVCYLCRAEYRGARCRSASCRSATIWPPATRSGASGGWSRPAAAPGTDSAPKTVACGSAFGPSHPSAAESVVGQFEKRIALRSKPATQEMTIPMTSPGKAHTAGLLPRASARASLAMRCAFRC